MRQNGSSQSSSDIVRDDDSSHVNACRVSPVLLYPAHIARTLADDFIIAPISFEFNDNEITAGPISGQDVNVLPRAAFDLTAQILKLSSPRQDMPLLDQQVFKVLFQGNPEIEWCLSIIHTSFRHDDVPSLLDVVEQQRERSRSPPCEFSDAACIVHGKGRVVPKAPLILEAQDIVIDLHITTMPNLMHLALQEWHIDLGGPPRLTRNQQHLCLTTTGATGAEGTLNLAQLRMLETGCLLPPM